MRPLRYIDKGRLSERCNGVGGSSPRIMEQQKQPRGLKHFCGEIQEWMRAGIDIRVFGLSLYARRSCWYQSRRACLHVAGCVVFLTCIGQMCTVPGARLTI